MDCAKCHTPILNVSKNHLGWCFSCGFGDDLSERRRPKTDENGLPSAQWLAQMWLDTQHEVECGNGNDRLVQVFDILIRAAYKARGEKIPDEEKLHRLAKSLDKLV